jgi:hypothetical protein
MFHAQSVPATLHRSSQLRQSSTYPLRAPALTVMTTTFDSLGA